MLQGASNTSLNLVLTCLRRASLTTPAQKVGRVVIWGKEEGIKRLFANSMSMNLPKGITQRQGFLLWIFNIRPFYSNTL